MDLIFMSIGTDFNERTTLLLMLVVIFVLFMILLHSVVICKMDPICHNGSFYRFQINGHAAFFCFKHIK